MYQKPSSAVKIIAVILFFSSSLGYGLVYPALVEAQQRPIAIQSARQDDTPTCQIQTETINPNTFAFTANASDHFEDFQWDLGDGATGSGNHIEHSYTVDGEFVVGLTCAGNDQMLTSSISVFADVVEPDTTESLETTPEPTPIVEPTAESTEAPLEPTAAEPMAEATEAPVEESNTDTELSVGTPDDELTGDAGSNPVGASCQLTLNDAGDDDPFTFNFGAIASGIESFQWDFGDSSPPPGNVANPSHTYTSTGAFTITLTCVDNDGDNITLNGFIEISSIPVASFVVTPVNTGFAPLDIFTVNQSTGGALTYLWQVTVPAGAPAVADSIAESPSYTFTVPGTYTITLTITDGAGQTASVFAQVVVVAPPPLADFTLTPGTGTTSTTFVVEGVDLGEGPIITTWSFDFSDGSPTVSGSGQGPYNVNYPADGIYTIILNYSGPGGNGSVSRQVGVYPPGTTVFADFTPTIIGNVPGGIEVCFDNISTGPIVRTIWDFGDGTPSVEDNGDVVCHVYASEQTYTVQLRVEAADPLVFSERDRDVIVIGGPQALINVASTNVIWGEQVTFTDGSSGTITLWEWDFNNDGVTDSTQQNPSAVSFTQLGANPVTLRVTGPGGTSTAQVIMQVAQREITCSISGNLNPGPNTTQNYDGTVSNLAGRSATYSWTITGPDNFSFTTEDISVLWSLRGTYFVTFSAVADNGASCSDTVNVEVDFPQLTCNILGNFNPVPDGSTYTYTADVNNIAGRTLIYQWFIDGNPVGTNSPTFDRVWLEAGGEPTEQISLVITTPDGTGACTVPAQTISVRWLDLQCDWANSISLNPNPLQNGGSYTYTLDLTNTNGLTPDIEWFLNGVRQTAESDADATSITFTWNFDDQGSYTLRVEAATSPAPRGSSCFIEESLNVNVPALQCRDPLGDRTPVVGETVNYREDLRRLYGRPVVFTWELQLSDSGTVAGPWTTVQSGVTGDPFPVNFPNADEVYRVRYTATVTNPSAITPTSTCTSNFVNITVEGVGEDFACDAWASGNDFTPQSGTANYTYTLDIDNSNNRTLFFEWILTDTLGNARSLGTFPVAGFTGDNTYSQVFNGSVFAPADEYTLSVNVTSTDSAYTCSYPAQALIAGELNVEYTFNVNRNQVAVGELICLTNISDTSHGTITDLDYEWDLDDISNSLGIVTFSGQDLPNCFSFPAEGVYTLQLTGTTQTGALSETFSRQFFVYGLQSIAIDRENEQFAGNNIDFSAIAVNIDSYSWEFFTQAGTSLGTRTGRDVTFFFANPGTYRAVVTGTGDLGDTVAEVTFDLIGINDLRAAFVPSTYGGLAPLTVCFDDRSYNLATIEDWIWDFGDGSPLFTYDQVTRPAQVCHTYNNPGQVYNVTLRVEEGVNFALASNVVRTYNVTEQNASFSIEPQGNGQYCYTPILNGGVNVVEWRYGDGTIVTPSDNGRVCHTYASSGGFLVTMVVTDGTTPGEITRPVNVDLTTPISPASFNITPVCNAGPVGSFTITNTGGDMTTPDRLTITDESGNILVADDFFQLANGETAVYNFSGVGGTITLTTIDTSINATVDCPYPNPIVNVAATCNGNFARFTISNSGGDMRNGPQAYEVRDAANNVVVSGTFEILEGGADVVVDVPNPYGAMTFVSAAGEVGPFNVSTTCSPAPTLTVSSTCSYPVTFTVTNTGGDMVIPQAFSITGPSGAVAFSPSASDFQLAANGSITYSLDGLNPYDAYTFNTSGFAGTQNEVRDCADPVIEVSSTCAYPVTFTVTNTGGEMLTPQAFSIAGPSGAVAFSPSASDFQLAANGSITYSLDGLNPYDAYTFNTSGFAGTQNEVRDCADPVIEVSSTCSYPVTFTVTNTGGEMLTPQAFSITGPSGAVAFSPSASDFQLAANGTITYSLDGLNPYDAYTFNTSGFAGTQNEVRDCADPVLTIGSTCGVPLQLELTNTGGDMLTVQDFTLLEPSGEVAQYTPSVTSFQLNQDESLTFDIPGGNPYDSYLFISDGFAGEIRYANDCDDPQLLAVTATCGTPTTFVVSNNGGDMVSPHDVVVTDNNGNPISVVPASFQLNSGASVTITTQGATAEIYTFSATGLGGTVSTTLNCSEPTEVAEVVLEPRTFLGINDLPAWETVPTCGFNCPVFEIYHSDETGDWEIFRLDGADDVTEQTFRVNLSQGRGEGIDDVAPSRSPNAEWIVFSSNRDGNWEIYVAPTDGDADLIQRVTFNTFAIDTDPVWGPHNYVVFESTRDGNWELYVVDMETGTEFRLTDDDANDINPYWSPDGSKIVFQSDRDGLWQLYELDLVTRQLRKLSDGEGADVDPQYSHDGSKIVFRSYRDGDNSVLYMMDANGENLQAITSVDEDATNHAFSPDDRLIAFQSDMDGDLDVYIYEVATGDRRQLTDNDIPDYAPTWLCDSEHVLFTSDIEGNPDIFEAQATPISDPAILVEEDADQQTFEDFNDIYPEGTPSEENASREGQTVLGDFGEQTTFLLPDFSLTNTDLSFSGVEALEEPNINACEVN